MKSKEYALCVIDADIVVYKAAASVQKKHYAWQCNGSAIETFDNAKACKEYKQDAEDFFGEDTSDWERVSWNVVGEQEDALRVADTMLKRIKDNVKAKKYSIYVDGEGNFREAVAKVQKYKGNREALERPVHLKAVKGHVKRKWKAKVIDSIEVDDIVAVVKSTGYYKNPEDCPTVNVVVDKDDLCAPGVSYNPDTETFHYQSEHEANLWLFAQVLAGDPTDHIVGLPETTPELRKKWKMKGHKGVGMKTAQAFLGGCDDIQEMWQRTLEAYQSYYSPNDKPYKFTDWRGNTVECTAEDMLDEQAELVFMMRRRGEHWHSFKDRYILGHSKRVIVAGGRTFNNKRLAFESLDKLLSGTPNDKLEIVEGGAFGADRLGRDWAKSRGVPFKTFEADWDDISKPDAVIRTRRDGKKYNAKAGNDRNTQMADYSNHLIAFWNGQSKGTKDMIFQAKSIGLTVDVVRYD